MTLQPQSLRIGNYVTCNNPFWKEKTSDVLLIVCSIDIASNLPTIGLKGYKDEILYQQPHQIDPIPLTEDILLRLGFEKRAFGNRWIWWQNVGQNYFIDLHQQPDGFYFMFNNMQHTKIELFSRY